MCAHRPAQQTDRHRCALMYLDMHTDTHRYTYAHKDPHTWTQTDKCTYTLRHSHTDTQRPELGAPGSFLQPFGVSVHQNHLDLATCFGHRFSNLTPGSWGSRKSAFYVNPSGRPEGVICLPHFEKHFLMPRIIMMILDQEARELNKFGTRGLGHLSGRKVCSHQLF